MKTTDEVLGELAARCRILRETGHHRLPTQRELAHELDTSRSTLRRALNIMAENGIISIVRGRHGGTYLVDADHERVPMIIDGRCVNRRLLEIASFTEMLAEQGFEVGTRVLAFELEAAEAHIASQLDISPREPVLSLLRVRFADGAPLSLEHMYLSFSRFPTLIDEGLGLSASVYALLEERYGVSIGRAEEEIEITPASLHAAHLLAIQPGDALLAIKRVAFDGEGRPLECSFDLFRGDRVRKTVVTLDHAVPGATPVDRGLRTQAESADPGDGSLNDTLANRQGHVRSAKATLDPT